MKVALKGLGKRLPSFPPLEAMRQKRKIKQWEQQGRPSPPPHAIKQRAIKSFAKKYGSKYLIETGTFYGDMVQAMRGSFERVFSIELSPELHKQATRRFAKDDNIEIIQGDSGVELGKLMPRLDQPTLFWLDGHYSAGVTAQGDKDTPIYEELTHIFNSQQLGHVILIDDARCFGTDPAYPTLDELSQFVKKHRPNAEIDVENDSIRIVPSAEMA